MHNSKGKEKMQIESEDEERGVRRMLGKLAKSQAKRKLREGD